MDFVLRNPSLFGTFVGVRRRKSATVEHMNGKTHIVDEQKSLSREKLSRKEAKKFDSEANRNKFRLVAAASRAPWCKA